MLIYTVKHTLVELQVVLKLTAIIVSESVIEEVQVSQFSSPDLSSYVFSVFPPF